MSNNIYVLVAMHPYETGEVEHVIGPFTTPEASGRALEQIMEYGGHPDAEYRTVQLTSLATHLADLKDKRDEEEDH